jgi:hypothetical protein
VPPCRKHKVNRRDGMKVDEIKGLVKEASSM